MSFNKSIIAFDLHQQRDKQQEKFNPLNQHLFLNLPILLQTVNMAAMMKY